MKSGGMKYVENLRPAVYQLVPLIKILNNNLNCILICDGVGVGKTISAGYIIFYTIFKFKQSGIVVCPPSLIIKWKEELDTKFSLRSVIVTKPEEFATMENELLTISKRKKPTVYIIPSSMISRYSLKSTIKISIIVFDEIHNFRNNETKGFEAAKNWSTHAHFKVGLSATPINNSVDDLISEFNILLPKYSWDGIATLIEDYWGKKKRKITNLLVTRFTKENLGIHFAKRIIENYEVSFPHGYASKIRSHLSYLPGRGSFFERVTYYRLAASSSEAFRKSMGLDEKLIESDPKIKLVTKVLEKRKLDRWIIFCEFSETVKVLKKELSEKWKVLVLTGEVPLFERHKVINEFREKTNTVLIMTPVGSEGLDVQFCNAVLNFDLHWNPMKIEQRIGRIDRVGQKSNEIFVSNIIVRGSIDERILQVIERKLNLISSSVFHVTPILSKKGTVQNLFDQEILKEEVESGQQLIKSLKFWESIPVEDYSILEQINKKYCNLSELIKDEEIKWFKKSNDFKNWMKLVKDNSDEIIERLDLYS